VCPLVTLPWSGFGRKKNGLTRVDSIDIWKLWISLDDTLDIHLRTEIAMCDSFDCVAILHGERAGSIKVRLSSTIKVHIWDARYCSLR